MSITDYRDNGKLVLTPIYLVFGLSAPIWFDLMRFGEIKLSSFAGLASVGIGDSFASIVGKKYGRSRIFRDGKSVEGKKVQKDPRRSSRMRLPDGHRLSTTPCSMGYAGFGANDHR